MLEGSPWGAWVICIHSSENLAYCPWVSSLVTREGAAREWEASTLEIGTRLASCPQEAQRPDRSFRELKWSLGIHMHPVPHLASGALEVSG